MPEATITLSSLRSSEPLKQRKSAKNQSTKSQDVLSELRQLLAGQTSLMRMIGARFIRKPGRFIVVSILTLMGVAIIINATTLQSDRHPSPFFAVAPLVTASVPLPPSKPRLIVSEPENAKQIQLMKDVQAALRQRGYYIGEINGQPSNRLDIAIREFEKAASLPITGEANDKLLTAVSASKLTMKDQLLVLIKDSAPNAIVDKSKTNLQVQRVLNKAGLGPLKEDGVFGATTQEALEKFEKSHKLAVRGEPNGRVLKELTAATGVVIE